MSKRQHPGRSGQARVVATHLAALVGAIAVALCPVSSRADVADTLNATLADLCDRKIVLLGEDAAHGSGETLAFKTELVTRLIGECGFDVVYFEASFYEFQDLVRRANRKEMLATADVAAAVGGLWSRDQEFAPLLPILLTGLQSGRLTLGGIDDQLGVAGARYANDQMMDELTAPFQVDDRSICRERFRRHVYSSYSPQHPYDAEEQAALIECVAKARSIATMIGGNPDFTGAALNSIERSISRSLLPGPDRFAARDQSMYENFTWMRHQLHPEARIIVWGATVHMARNARMTGLSGDAPIFGEWVHQNVPGDVFSLGFSAAGGSYRRPGMADPVDIGLVAFDEMEQRALAGETSHSIYLDKTSLSGFGEIEARAFTFEPVKANWAELLDGLVIFRHEGPPVRQTAPAR